MRIDRPLNREFVESASNPYRLYMLPPGDAQRDGDGEYEHYQ